MAEYLQPWVDTISKEMEASVSLLIMLPVSNGEVELRSLHVNTPTGLPGMTWPVVDPLGFEEAQQSVTRYARTVFREYSCQMCNALMLTEIFSS